jgi:tripartite-type tricarboxylate transporter receptor subunit TctC
MINGNLTIARLLNPAVRYDPLKDLAPVSLIGVAPLVLVAPAGAPGTAAHGFFDAARAAGDRWSYGSPGVGTVGHLGMELLKSRSGIAPLHVPYPGYPQVFNAMVAGDLQLSMLPPALAQAQIKAGKLRGIAVTSSGRSTLAAELPSLAEAGVKDFNLEIWNAVAAPASMPRPHVDKLAAAIGAIVRTPEMRQRLFQQGWQAVGSSPEGLARRMQADTQVLGAIIRAQRIKAE